MPLGEKILVVSPNCPSCKNVKEFLKKNGLLDNVKVLDVADPESLEFARKAGVMGVPECLIIEGEGRKRTVRICTDDEWQRMLEGK